MGRDRPLVEKQKRAYSYASDRKRDAPQGGVEQLGAPPQLPANGRHRYNTAECARS